jgi:hypothetical protein
MFILAASHEHFKKIHRLPPLRCRGYFLLD